MKASSSNKRSSGLAPTLLTAAIAALALPAWACGPDFPSRLLEDRATLMAQLAEGSFDYEAALLSPKPASGLVPVESPWDAPSAARIAEEKKEGDAAYGKIEAMRVAANDASAWALGDGLLDDVRLYTAGARAFHAGDYNKARQRFAAVVALPASERGKRGVWAQFMLARVERDSVGGAGLTPAQNAAHKAAATQGYEAVRAVVVQDGADDPLGLAVASYGDEARMHLDGGDAAAAAALYAQQAALGSASGRASLLMVAREVFGDEARLVAALKSPVLQRLLAAYVYTRSDDFGEGARLPDAALTRYYAAIEAADPASLLGVDRVAAAAYRSGEFGLAGKLAARSETPLALWVRAKLALSAGDVKGATEAYAQASRAFPRDEQWGYSSSYDSPFHPACRVDGERAVLALDRGDYAEALRLLHAGKGDYWFDEAYVAERVLTADELKAFVDANVPAPKAPPETNGFAQQTDTQLRNLLGRRLMRAGRYDEAVPYFSGKALEPAQQYAGVRNAAEKSKGTVRGEYLFIAAKLARESGMEILGAEMDPDHAIVDGAYDLGAEVFPSPHPYIKDDEIARYQASKVHPEQRFHYRYVAADLANRAADLMPPRSQAFAAILCSATGWLINRDYDAGRAIYARYVKQGPYVPWGGSFGNASACPAPDFLAAQERVRQEHLRELKRRLRAAAPWVAGALGLAVIGFVVWWRRRRKPAA